MKRQKGFDLMTKKEYFTIIRESFPASNENYDNVVEFCNHELELLNRKRSSGERKPTSKQVANAAIKDEIVAYLTEQDSPVKANDIMSNVEGLTSIPHLSALLAQLRAAKIVKREYEKKTPIYSLGVEGE